jgi:hypothetical protein
MFELADRLVGIFKTKDVTKSVTINPKAIAAACALAPVEATMPSARSEAAAAGGGKVAPPAPAPPARAGVEAGVGL